MNIILIDNYEYNINFLSNFYWNAIKVQLGETLKLQNVSNIV